jgi:hypothetical protein
LHSSRSCSWSSGSRFGCSKASAYSVGAEFILLSVRAFVEFSDCARVTCNKKSEMLEWSANGLFREHRIRRFQRYLQKGKRRNGRHSNPVSRQQWHQNVHNAVRIAYGNPGGKGVLQVSRLPIHTVMQGRLCLDLAAEYLHTAKQWKHSQLL